MVKRWCLYLAALLGCMVFYLANQLWLSWVLLWTVLALPVFSLVLSLPGMLTIRLEIICSGKTGLKDKEAVGVKRLCPVPAPYCRYRLAVTRVTTGESFVLQPGQDLPTDHCGKLVCRVEKGRAYDMLGLFFLPVRNLGQVGVVVMPRPVALPDPPDLERYMSSAWQVKPGGGFAENHELRLYRSGDSLRQIHWKLSAKSGKLVVREAMEPRRGRMLLTMDINGSAEALDEKFGQLLWMGKDLLERGLQYEILVLGGSGVLSRKIATENDLMKAVEDFLSLPPVTEGTALEREKKCAWHFHIGGVADEG